MSNREQQIRREVEADFETLERLAHPEGVGVLDLLDVYGGYEAAIQQAEAYLGLIDFHPTALSAASSNSKF